jgi:ubiquinone/menaquinone biosynthesis C-methylase UbiE
VARTALDPKSANLLYHDAAAATYDAKWAISFEEPARSYVRERADRMLPRSRYQEVLEVGAGTGFFLINLWQAGFVAEAHATDLSHGMLDVCRLNAEALGCPIRTRTGDAERLPYEDGAFDLVVGHAFLHHVPEPREALAEMRRVLRPGGAIFIAGEPTRLGHGLAGVSKLAARTSFRVAALVPGLRGIRRGRPPSATPEERILRDLEFEVDLHTFRPRDVASWAEAAGFVSVHLETEELLASMFGWAVRTVEGEARDGLLGRRWAGFAYRGWRSLYGVDRLLERLLPPQLFYNLLLYAEKPAR